MKYIQKYYIYKSQIKNILPHRDPFLFIDEINELGEDYIIGTKHVNEDEYYFKDTFQAHQSCLVFFNLKLWHKLVEF